MQNKFEVKNATNFFLHPILSSSGCKVYGGARRDAEFLIDESRWRRGRSRNIRFFAIFRDTFRIIHLIIPANSSVPRFAILSSWKARRNPLISSACILGDARMSRISMRPLRVTSTLLSLAYLHSIFASVRCTCTGTRCCRAERKGSRLSFSSFETPGDGRPVLHILPPSALQPRTRIRTIVHHTRVHLSNGIAADLSGILTTIRMRNTYAHTNDTKVIVCRFDRTAKVDRSVFWYIVDILFFYYAISLRTENFSDEFCNFRKFLIWHAINAFDEFAIKHIKY